MKKTVMILTLALLALLAAACGAENVKGDVDSDGKITAEDARAVLRHCADIEALAEDMLGTADFDSDGSVRAADARMILRFAAGLDRPRKEFNDPNAQYLAARFVAENGTVVNKADTDARIDGAAADGEYFSGGTVTLPQGYVTWTVQIITDYNEQSSQGLFPMIRYWPNNDHYEECDNALRLEEIQSPSKACTVRFPWVADSWNHGYKVTIPIHLYAHANSKGEYFPLGDSFWSITSDRSTGRMYLRIDGQKTETYMPVFTYSDGGERILSRNLPQTFALSSEHKFREIRVYTEALSDEDTLKAYEAADIVVPDENISRITDGITDMGSSFAIIRDSSGLITPFSTEKTAGGHTASGFYRPVSYTVRDFVTPDNGLDNTKYESVHITNAPEKMEKGRQYPLTAYPYPFFADEGDEFSVGWTSDDTGVIAVIDGLLIAKSAGRANVTATLCGTDISETVCVEVYEKVTEDKVFEVPADYVSADGDVFSGTDYESTTRAIYAAIDEAHEKGFSRVVFPKIEFRAVPLMDERTGDGLRHYLPSGITVEFPEGSVFRMMDSPASRYTDGHGKELRYFCFGVPETDYENVCEDSHVIVDRYLGERYDTSAPETVWLEGNNFVYFGRKAVGCSCEIREAYGVAGYFIYVCGNHIIDREDGVIRGTDFAAGRIDDNGNITENGNWISTEVYEPVPDYGSDGYYIARHGQNYHAEKYVSGCSAKLYDIHWYDADRQLILSERMLGVGEFGKIPEGAAFFRISLQQKVPDNTSDNPWLAMQDDSSAKNCEIKNTRIVGSSSCGLFSAAGSCDGLWVHDCFIGMDGVKPRCERVGDFEEGWHAMRHCVVSNNFMAGYFGCTGGYNIFFHSNYIADYSGFSGEEEMIRYINNTSQSVEISEKLQAHIYNNVLNEIYIDRQNTSEGKIYCENNVKGERIYSY